MKTLFLLGLLLTTTAYGDEKPFDLDEQINLYTDCLGRTTLLPANISECENENYDTNNALLFTGELVILLKELKGISPEIKNRVLTFIPKHFVKPGLLSRHPEPYRFREDMKPISFDEFTGVAFMAAVIPELRKDMDDVVKYGIENNWQYWDMPGYEKGKSWFELLHPLALAQLVPYLQEESLRKSTVNYPRLYPIFATHHFHQRAFYKMMSNSYKPNWFETVYFAAASYLAETTENSSSLAMWLFRYKALDHKPMDNSLIRYAQARWRAKMLSRFGEKYEQIIFQRYYEDKNHPFHKIAEIQYMQNAINYDIMNGTSLDSK